MRAVRCLVLLFAATMVFGIPGVLPARAEIVCYVKDKRGNCTLSVSVNPSPGGGGGEGGGGAPGLVTVDGHSCFSVEKADPQPSSDDPVWGGHYPEGGIYKCIYYVHIIGGDPGGLKGNSSTMFWSPVPLGGPSPEELARQAVEDMHLTAPAIGLTGYGHPDSMQVIGLPTWMWVADPGESTTGPITRSASAGGLTVSATARLRETVWNMGDGGAVTCSGESAPGTPYADSYDKAPSPTCGYRYPRTSADQPGKAYSVTVTSNWEIAWSGGGQSGVITMSLPQSTQLRVGEVQVIVNGSGQGKR